MYQSDRMHPRDCFTEFAPYATYQWLVELGMTYGVVDELEQFAARDMFQHKAVVRRRAERVQVRDNRRMCDVLRGKERTRQ